MTGNKRETNYGNKKGREETGSEKKVKNGEVKLKARKRIK